MVHLTEQILCITNNYAYKEQFRNILSPHHNVSILFIHNIADAILKLQSRCFVLVIIDEVLSIENPKAFNELLKLITSLCINLHTLIIVPKTAETYFSKYIPQGFTYIADMQIAKHMLPAVLKHISEFKSQKPPFLQKISYKGLVIHPQSNTIYLKGCSISISTVGILILFFLIRHDGYCDICAIQKYLGSMLEKPVSESYITVNMHRLSKRIKDVTGLDIIKNRYGIGYYLVL